MLEERQVSTGLKGTRGGFRVVESELSLLLVILGPGLLAKSPLHEKGTCGVCTLLESIKACPG